MNRSIPTGLARRLLFGRRWGIAAILTLFVLALLPFTECRTAIYDRKTTATVTSAEAMNSFDDDDPVYRVHYSFHDDRGTAHQGTSYTTDGPITGTHEILYVHHDPSESRIIGTRTHRFGLGAVIAIVIFLAFGPGFALRGYQQGKRWLRLLRHGTETSATQTARVHLPSTNGESPERWHFMFGSPSGDAYSLVTTDKYFPRNVRILHDSTDLTTIEEMPVDIMIDGNSVGPDPGYSRHLLVLPFITACLVAATVVSMIWS